MGTFSTSSIILIVVIGLFMLAWICRRDYWLLLLNGIVVTGTCGLALMYASTLPVFWSVLIPLVVTAALVAVNWMSRQQYLSLQQALRDLAVREDRLIQAAGLAKLGYYYYDTVTQRVVDCTEQHARNHGVSHEDYLRLASTLDNEMPLIHEDDRELLRLKYREVLEGKRVDLSYRVPTTNGIVHVKETTQPVFDDAGKVIAEIGTTMDITQQVRNENQLLLSQKMETMAMIAAGVAHDFNNLLNIILLNQEMLLDDLGSSSARRWVRASIDAVRRGSRLARSLQSFARQSDLQPKVFDLNALVRRTRILSESFVPASVELEVSFLSGLWSVEADPGLAENVVLNLMLNALDAMPDGGKLTVETANVRVEKEYVAARNETLIPGRYVLLAISDTGIGIELENQDRVFEPFFTTKGSTGSGLGLSMVLGFMKQSNGTVRLYSEPGVGSSFNLYFPAADSEVSYDFSKEYDEYTVISEAAIRHTASTRSARLLFVDDEEDIREIACQALEVAGYDVVSAENGDRALEIYKADPNFDVLITDIVMPGDLNGPALAKEIRKRTDDSISVIFLSGYPAEASVHGNGLQPQDIRLQKPYRNSELIKRIETLVIETEREAQDDLPKAAD